VLSWVRRH